MSFENDILASICSCICDYPSRTAFYIADESFTYHQLGERISSVRQYIKNNDDGRQVWGLRLYDSLNTYASIFALWMEGKSYVPLHPGWPSSRIEDIKRQVNYSSVLDDCDAPFVEDLLDNWAICDDDNLAYILFTSGSTGNPKGVRITRGNLNAFMDSFWKTGIEINVTDRCAQLFDLTFDVSVQSFLAPLMRGACVYTVPYGQVKYLYAAALIQKHHITFGAMAPSMLAYLKPYFSELDVSALRICILTAEGCPIDLAEAWQECASNTEIYDFYGPTEATIYCTYYKLNRGGANLSLNGIISIGKPMANVRAVIIDEDGNVIPECSGAEHKGELCVSGKQVTPGYWDNPEKNIASFFEKEGVRYYHTGDLCYWDESGNIMYCGRIDQQVKIQGFRVELAEIEYYARAFFNNQKRAVAIAFQNERNLTEIALFIESTVIDVKKLIGFLRSKLPEYMIPTKILYIDNFPLNKSEKVDRNALKQRLL